MSAQVRITSDAGTAGRDRDDKLAAAHRVDRPRHRAGDVAHLLHSTDGSDFGPANSGPAPRVSGASRRSVSFAHAVSASASRGPAAPQHAHA